MTGSLKPALTKRPYEVSYRKLNEMLGSVSMRQKHWFSNFWGKTIWENGAYSECVDTRARGRGFEKLVIRYVRTKWMVPNKCCGIFFLCIGLAKYTRASSPARKMLLFSSIIITIVLSYAIIKIYTILHIYLQVSKTEGL